MAQVKNTCDIAVAKYPLNKHTIVFVFDQSSCHTKYDDNTLIAKNILVKDGGSRRIRDTIWAGNVGDGASGRPCQRLEDHSRRTRHQHCTDESRRYANGFKQP